MTPREVILQGVVEELRTLETAEGQRARHAWRVRELDAFAQWRGMNQRRKLNAHPERTYDGAFHLRYVALERRSGR